jgi:acyl-CoA thioesterase-1
MLHRLLAASVLAAGVLAAPAQAADSGSHQHDCAAPAELVRLNEPLYRIAARVTRKDKLTIVALGSSSTAGVGASTEQMTYPARLEAKLRVLFPGMQINVVNRGVSGEDAMEMLERLDDELQQDRPDLVLWQVGTNALLRANGVDGQAPLIRDGIRRIQASGAETVIVDPQYAPKVLVDADAKPMVRLLEKVAREAGVPVFKRFAIMEYWHETRDISFNEFLSSDLFHMNDWSYGCIAENIASALALSMTAPAPATAQTPATGPTQSASARPAN